MAALRTGIRDAVVLARTESRRRGQERLIGEAESLGIDLSPKLNRLDFFRDWARADAVGQSYATRWLKKANDLGVEQASTATEGSLTRIAVTESSQAFSAARVDLAESLPERPRLAEVSHLMRVWDATLDNRTCEVCEAADGKIVGLNEAFPEGEPGSVHSNCRCTFTLVGMTFKR